MPPLTPKGEVYMLEAVSQALAAFLNPSVLAMTFLGAFIGAFLGLIPGLGGTGAVAFLLAFVLHLPPEQALALMIGALAVVHTSDTIAGVLFGAPGSASAAVSTIDGHALALQGQAARALSVAFLSSMAGGLMGAVGLTLSIPIARPLVLAFGAPELFMLCLMGISFAGALSEGQASKGVVSACLGMLLGLIGPAPAVAEYRYTMGELFLMDGLPLVGVALGVFGLAEMAELLGRGGAVAKGRIHIGTGWREGLRDFIRHKWHVVRGALIGIWAGVLPGVGATAGAFMAYGQAYATAKDKSTFGKGDVRGIIAPEAANNSVEAGDLIPTLLFSIPGGTPSAILMGLLLMYGIQPGPRIVTDHLDIMYTIVWSFTLASVVGAGLCFVLSPVLARLTHIPFYLVAPGLAVLMFLGTYQAAGSLGDLAMMLFLGALGWILKQTGYPRAPLLIGFVMMAPLERYYWLTAELYGRAWVKRPWVIVLGIVLIAIIWSMRTSRKAAVTPQAEVPMEEQEEEGRRPVDTRWALGMSSVLLVTFAGALAAAFSYSPQARLTPVLVGTVGCVASLVQVCRDALQHMKRPVAEWFGKELGPGVAALALLGCLLLLTWVFGLTVAGLVFVVSFLCWRRARWRTILLYGFGLAALLLFLSWVVGVKSPTGMVRLL